MTGSDLPPNMAPRFAASDTQTAGQGVAPMDDVTEPTEAAGERVPDPHFERVTEIYDILRRNLPA